MSNLIIKQKDFIINILNKLKLEFNNADLSNADLINYCSYIIDIFTNTLEHEKDLYKLFYDNLICKKINQYNSLKFMIDFINTLSKLNEFNEIYYNVIYFEYIKYIALVSVNPNDKTIYHKYELLDMFHEFYCYFYIYDSKYIETINYNKFKFFLNMLGNESMKFTLIYKNKELKVKPQY